MTYAIVSIGGKQYRVREGERLVVDRLPQDEGKTFHPQVLFLGGDGKGELGPKGVTVTARVVGHVLGDKVRIGKYRPKSGYRRHTGFRARLSQIEIEKIGKRQTRSAAAKAEGDEAPAKPKAAAERKQEESE
jgi:large subunit ribosomal protein L21